MSECQNCKRLRTPECNFYLGGGSLHIYLYLKRLTNVHLCSTQPSFLPLFFLSLSRSPCPSLATGTCQRWPRQLACLPWTSITHCPRRCLPSRSRLPTPATPCLCPPPHTLPTRRRRTSRCCDATRCRCTRRGATSPTGSSSAAATCETARAAFPPAPTGWLRRKSTKAPRSTSPRWSNQREAVGVGAGPDSMATWRHAATNRPETWARAAACQTVIRRRRKVRARHSSVCRTWTPPSPPPSTGPCPTRGLLTPRAGGTGLVPTHRPDWRTRAPNWTMHPTRETTTYPQKSIYYRHAPIRNIFILYNWQIL